MSSHIDTIVLTGNDIEPRFPEIKLIASFGPLSRIEEETLRLKVIPNHARHFVFIGDCGIAIGYETEERYMVLNKKPKDPRLHVWFASTPEIFSFAHDYLLANTPHKRTTLLVWPNQTDLTLYALRNLTFYEEVRAGEIYGTKPTFKK